MFSMLQWIWGRDTCAMNRHRDTGAPGFGKNLKDTDLSSKVTWIGRNPICNIQHTNSGTPTQRTQT